MYILEFTHFLGIFLMSIPNINYCENRFIRENYSKLTFLKRALIFCLMSVEI